MLSENKKAGVLIFCALNKTYLQRGERERLSLSFDSKGQEEKQPTLCGKQTISRREDEGGGTYSHTTRVCTLFGAKYVRLDARFGHRAFFVRMSCKVEVTMLTYCTCFD